MDKEKIGKYLISKCCGVWDHPKTGETRIYLNRFAKELLEIETDYYNTGNLSSFYWHGEKESNCYGKKILATIEKAYFSMLDGNFHCSDIFHKEKFLEDELMEAVTARIEAEEAGITEESGKTGESGNTEEKL